MLGRSFCLISVQLFSPALQKIGSRSTGWPIRVVCVSPSHHPVKKRQRAATELSELPCINVAIKIKLMNVTLLHKSKQIGLLLRHRRLDKSTKYCCMQLFGKAITQNLQIRPPLF